LRFADELTDFGLKNKEVLPPPPVGPEPTCWRGQSL
jgi:hypothetical protein